MSFFETFNNFANKAEQKLSSEQGQKILKFAEMGVTGYRLMKRHGDDLGRIVQGSVEDIRKSPDAIADVLVAASAQFDAVMADMAAGKKEDELAVRQRTLDAMQRLDAARSREEQLGNLEELQFDEIVDAGVRAHERTTTPLTEEQKQGFRDGVRTAQAARDAQARERVMQTVVGLVGLLNKR